MKKFKVQTVSTEVVTKYYEVEAESAEDALERVENGEVDEEDSDIDVTDFEYLIEED